MYQKRDMREIEVRGRSFVEEINPEALARALAGI